VICKGDTLDSDKFEIKHRIKIDFMLQLRPGQAYCIRSGKPVLPHGPRHPEYPFNDPACQYVGYSMIQYLGDSLSEV
jgi:hypothetical protein